MNYQNMLTSELEEIKSQLVQDIINYHQSLNSVSKYNFIKRSCIKSCIKMTTTILRNVVGEIAYRQIKFY